MKSLLFGVALIAIGFLGLAGVVFAQSSESKPTPQPQATSPQPSAAPPQPQSPSPAEPSQINSTQPSSAGAQPSSNQNAKTSTTNGGSAPSSEATPSFGGGSGAITPPPREQGLKVDGTEGSLSPASDSEFRVFKTPKPFDFESATSYDETTKRDLFYFRGISDLYRKPDQGGTGIEDSKDRLTQYDLDNFEVLGIMWDVSKPKAIIRDPLGGFHNLVKGTKIGVNNGAVVGIREGEVIVLEYAEEEDRVVKKPRVMVIKSKTK